MNEDLLKLVENKSVAIIGPASYLVDTGHGKTIDEYDVIIRPNHFCVPKELHKDYGARTDIMFHNFGTPWMAGLKDNIFKNQIEFEKLKMIACPVIKSTHAETDIMSWPEDRISDVVKNAESVNQHQVPFYWVGVKKYQNLAREVGCEPYTGVLTILTILDYPVKELYVSGFDFYMSSKVYADGFANPIDGALPPTGGGHGYSCAQRQISIFKNRLKQYKILRVDEHLKKITDTVTHD